MAVEILVTTSTLDRHKDFGNLCLRYISEAIAFSRLLASNERVPRALQATGIKASMPLLVCIFPSLLAFRLLILKELASLTVYCAESAKCCILGEYSGLQQVTSMSFSLR